MSEAVQTVTMEQGFSELKDTFDDDFDHGEVEGPTCSAATVTIVAID